MKLAFAAIAPFIASCAVEYPYDGMSRCTSVAVTPDAAHCDIQFRGCPDHGTADAVCDSQSCVCTWKSDFTSGTVTNDVTIADFCTQSAQVAKEDVCELCGGCGA